MHINFANHSDFGIRAYALISHTILHNHRIDSATIHLVDFSDEIEHMLSIFHYQRVFTIEESVFRGTYHGFLTHIRVSRLICCILAQWHTS